MKYYEAEETTISVHELPGLLVINSLDADYPVCNTLTVKLEDVEPLLILIGQELGAEYLERALEEC